MPISLEVPIQKTSTVLQLRNPLNENNSDWLALWYCGIYKNKDTTSQPNVLVAFRKLLENSQLSNELILRRVPLTTLGQVRVGSIWNSSECRTTVVYEESSFEIDFRATRWNHTSFHHAYYY